MPGLTRTEGANDQGADPTKARAKFAASGENESIRSNKLKEGRAGEFHEQSNTILGVEVSRRSIYKGKATTEKVVREQSKRSNKWSIGLVLVLGAAAIGAMSFRGCTGSPTTTSGAERVSFVTTESKAYRVLPRTPPPLPQGSAGTGTLIDMYIRANKPISDRFSQMNSAKSVGKNLGGFTLISGVAGVGKSFIVRHLSDLLGEVRTIDLRKDLYKDPTVLPHVEQVGQLSIDVKASRWFNQMPGLVNSNGKRMNYGQIDALLRPLLSPPTTSTVTVLDSLDEIHPDDATSVLELVESIAKSVPEAHFVIFGRPESFRPFLTATNGGRDRQGAHVPLLPAAYETTADIETFVRDQELHSKQPLPPSVREPLIREFASSASIRPCLGMLALTNFCYESVRRRLESGTSPDDESFREEIFQNLLERNNLSHGRPSKAVPETMALYRAALERIAVEYRNKVDDAGFFLVGYSDTVTIPDGATVRVFNAAEVLDFSGLVEINPVEAQSRHYRFVPTWLHVHLLQSYRRAQDKQAMLWSVERFPWRTCSASRQAA